MKHPESSHLGKVPASASALEIGMRASLRADLKKLNQRAFHRGEWGKDLMRRLHRLLRSKRSEPETRALESLRRWLLVPLTLWPVFLEGLGRQVVDLLERGYPLDPASWLLIELLGSPPSDAAQSVTDSHEHQIQAGRYESLIHSDHKFAYLEQELMDREEFRKDWSALKGCFDIGKYQDRKGMLRRRMLPERNYRSEATFAWDTESDQFAEVFDVFCWRWNLYGMQKDKPLLMKLTVNLTPFGTMIFIPGYWSFDAKRDIKWKSVTSLHRSRGVQRQGPKLSQNKVSAREEAVRVRQLWEEATTKGKRGEAREQWVLGRMNWDPRTDSSKLKRMLKLVSKEGAKA